MDFGVPNIMSLPMPLAPFELGPDTFPDVPPKRIIGIDITFTSADKPPIRRSFLRSQFKSVHLGREPAEMSGVANAFARTDVVPPVMSRKHAEILFAHDEPQVKDIGSYHGTYFQAGGQRLIPHKPYQLLDGSVLEFGKSVTKDDKAHEPLTATIKFIREPDHPVRAQRMPSFPFSPGSPPRRYGIPSDSEDEEDMDEDESEDEDLDSNGSGSGSSTGSDVFEYTPSQQPTHIDLTGLSDEDAMPKFGYDSRDGIECLGFGYAPPKNTYHEESASSSDMSESEYEDDAAKVIAPPIASTSTSTIQAVPALPQPIRLPSLIASISQITEPRGLGEMDVAAPRGDIGPSEEVRTLKAELAVAQVEIAQLKRSLETQAERERQADKDGDVQIPEPAAADVPTRIAKIEDMMMQLASVGDGEICEYRTAVHEMLGQLSAGIDALRIRVGLELPSSSSPGNNNKRKRSEEDEEEDSIVESRRAQSPMPASVSTSTQVSQPIPAPSPSKRSRIAGPAVGVIAGGAAMWSALAFGYI